jgi:hypothetical protein
MNLLDQILGPPPGATQVPLSETLPPRVAPQEESLDETISRIASQHEVDPSLIKAIVQAESAGDPNAVSKRGAQGLMQLMPDTATSLGVKDPFDPVQNLTGGTQYVKQLLDRYKGDVDKALAAYNWGPKHLDRGKGVLPRETKGYVQKIKASLKAAAAPETAVAAAPGGSYFDQMMNAPSPVTPDVKVPPPDEQVTTGLQNTQDVLTGNNAMKALEFGGDVASWELGRRGGTALSRFIPGPTAKVLLPMFGAGVGYAFPDIVKRALGLSKAEDASPLTDTLVGAAIEGGFNALGPGFRTGAKVLGPLLKGPGEFIERNFSKPVWNQMKDFANWKIFPGSEEAMEAGTMTPFKFKKSLADVWQPAVERMSNRLSSTFRENSAIKSNAAAEGEAFGKAVLQEDPEVRLDLIAHGLNPSELKNKTAKDLTKGFIDNLNKWGLTQTQTTEIVDEVGSNLSNYFKTQGGTITDQAVTGPLMKVISNIGKTNNVGLKSRWGTLVEGPIQSELSRVIEHPGVSGDLKALARDLHDLPVILPLKVGESVRKVMRSDLLYTLRSMKNVVLEDMPASRVGAYLPSKTFLQPGGKNAMWVKRDVELELRAMEDVPKAAHHFMNKWFLSPWKTAKVILVPAANIRNDFTNVIQSHVNGLSFWNMERYIDTFKSMKGQDLTGKYGRQGTPEAFKRMTGVGGTFSMNDIVEYGKGMKSGATMFDTILSLHDKVVAKPREWYGVQETFFKYANYLNNLKNGMKPREAAQNAVDALFDYGEITRATANLRSNVMPFATWTSKVIPLTLEKIVHNPVKFGSAIYLYHSMQNWSLNNLNMSEGEATAFTKALPDWMRQGIMFPLPWRDEEGRIQMLDLTYLIPGFGDVLQVSNNLFNSIFSNPLLGISAMLSTNRKFSGAPVYNEWDSAWTKMGKSAGAIWESITPSLIPGGLDFNRLWNSGVGTYYANKGIPRRDKDLTPSQFLAGQAGFRTVPVHEAEVFRKHEALGKIRKSEIEQAFARDFKSARSQADVDKLVLKYRDALEWLGQKNSLSP